MGETMANLLLRSFCFVFLLVVVGCGNQGAPGNGNTVFMQATIKQGTTGAVFTNVSGFTFRNISSVRTATTPNSMSFTINSTIYPNANKILASDIDVFEMDFSYTPLEFAPGRLSPAFVPTVPRVPYSGRLTAGGSLAIDNVPIIWPNDLNQILDNAQFIGVPAGSVLPYRISVTFLGREVNTGINLSNTISIGAFIAVK
jgi:hypothetical protein